MAAVTSVSLSDSSERAERYSAAAAERECSGPRPHPAEPPPGRPQPPSLAASCPRRHRPLQRRRPRDPALLDFPFPRPGLSGPPPAPTPHPTRLQDPPRLKLAAGNGPWAAGAACPGGGARPFRSEEPWGGGRAPPGQCRWGRSRAGRVRALLLPKASPAPRVGGLQREGDGGRRATGPPGLENCWFSLGVAKPSREENGAWCKSLLFPDSLLRTSPTPTPPATNLPPPCPSCRQPGGSGCFLAPRDPLAASWWS